MLIGNAKREANSATYRLGRTTRWLSAKEISGMIFEKIVKLEKKLATTIMSALILDGSFHFCLEYCRWIGATLRDLYPHFY